MQHTRSPSKRQYGWLHPLLLSVDTISWTSHASLERIWPSLEFLIKSKPKWSRRRRRRRKDCPACPPVPAFVYPVSSASLLLRSNHKLNTSPSNPITHCIKSPFLLLPFSFKSTLWRLNPPPSIHHLNPRHCSSHHHQGIPQTHEVFSLALHHRQCPTV